MRHFFAFLLALFFAGAAHAQTQVQFGLQTGSNPRALGVYDQMHTFVPFANLDSTGHTLTFTGPATLSSLTIAGYLAATTSGTLTNGHCVSINALGNLVDAGAACTTGGGTVSSGAAGQLSYYVSTGTVVSGATTGTGVLTALGNTANANGGAVTLNGSPTVGDCLKWSSTGVQDAGGACGGATGFYNINTAPGVVCDGATNTTTAFQTAINAATTANLEARFSGVCVVSNISISGTLKLVGAGRGASVLRRPAADSSNAPALNITGSYDTFRDFTVDGNKSSETVVAYNNIMFSGSAGTFDNIESINAYGGNGLAAYNTGDATNGSRSKIVNSAFRVNGGAGVYADTAQLLDIEGNDVAFNGGAGIQFIHYSFPPVTNYQVYVNIIGNQVHGNTGSGISVCCGNVGGTSSLPVVSSGATTSTQFVVSGNTVVLNAGYGIAVYGYAMLVSGNVVSANGASNCAGGGCGGINGLGTTLSITNNVVVGNYYWGIDLGGSANCVVSGNTINNTIGGTGGAEINYGGMNNCVISHNNIKVYSGAGGSRTVISGLAQEYGGGDYFVPGSGTVIEGNTIDLSNTGSIGISNKFYLNVTIRDNTCFNTTAPNQCVVLEETGGFAKQSGNFDAAQASATGSSFVTITSASTLVIPDTGDEFYVNGSTNISNVVSYSMNAFSGKVGLVSMTNGGSGYTQASPGSVSFSGGGCSTEPAGTPVADNAGQILSVNLSNNGAGCTSAPSALFSGGAGSGAAGTPQYGSPNIEGRHITLYFLGVLTISNGANLSLVSSHTTAAGYSILKLFGTFGGVITRWTEEGYSQ